MHFRINGLSAIGMALIATVSATEAFASNSVSADSSAGFATAQITNSQYFSDHCNWVWDPVTSSFHEVCSAAGSQAASAQTNFNFREQKASASADVSSPSLLHARAAASSKVPTFDNLRSSASANFNDQLTFDVAGHAGESLLVFVRYSLSGTALTVGSGDDRASGSADLGMRLGSYHANIGGGTSSGYNYGFLAAGQVQSPYRIFSIEAGGPQDFSLNLSAYCDAQTFSASVGCSIDASFRFLGISAVALPDGTEITDFSVKSSSGYDYVNATAAVPEPQTYALMLAGLGLIAGAARRRNK